MKRQIELLAELQRMDSVIIEKTRLIASIPSKISSMEAPLREAEARLAAERARQVSVEKKKKDKERGIEEVKDKINKLKARTNDIKTNKEYQAHLKEIESKEKEILGAEDEILGLMVELDSVSSSVKAAQRDLDEEKKKLDALRAGLDSEVGAGKKELEEMRGKRASVSDLVEPDLYNHYMALLDSLNGLAVVEAKAEVCKGCNMNIPPQLFVELKKNEELMHCPQCKRILYYKPSAPEEASS